MLRFKSLLICDSTTMSLYTEIHDILCYALIILAVQWISMTLLHKRSIHQQIIRELSLNRSAYIVTFYFDDADEMAVHLVWCTIVHFIPNDSLTRGEKESNTQTPSAKMANLLELSKIRNE